MADIATEMEAEMADMVDDQEKTTHGREATKTMGTTTILASSEDTRDSRTAFGLSCGGFLEYSVFPPFINRGKRFFGTFQQGNIVTASYLLTSSPRPSLLSPDTKALQSTSMVIRHPLRRLTLTWITAFGTLWLAFSFTTCLLCFE
jgi:hypothetical protein